MSSVRRKPAKALLCLVLALSVAAVFLLSSSAVFAGTDQSKVDSKLEAKGIGKFSRVTGTLNLKDNAIDQTELQPVKNSEGEYEGKLHITLESTDLFGQAYQLYKDRFENEKFGSANFKNLVMSDLGSDDKAAFPTIEYTVTLPDTVKVINSEQTPIEATSTTSTISRIKYETKDAQQVQFSMYLGNWNDYEGFFNLLKPEFENPSQHTIDITIPFVVSSSGNNDTQSLGNIQGSGHCYLYKFGKIFHKTKVVSVDSTNTIAIPNNK